MRLARALRLRVADQFAEGWRDTIPGRKSSYDSVLHSTMAIPTSWPPHVQQRARQFLALLKYYRFSQALSEAAVPFLSAGESGMLLNNDDRFRGAAFLNYWIASLHTLSEGWSELGLHDDAIGRLLTEERRKILRKYRNTVFHFQVDLEDVRIGALEAKPEVVAWVMALGDAFQNFFRHHDETIDVERIRPWLFRLAKG